MSNSKCNGEEFLKLSEHMLFDYMHFSVTNIARVNNVDVVVTEDGEELGFCHIPVFNNLESIVAVKGLLGVYLAMKHLNNGNGEVVPELEGITSRCDMRFTTEFFNDEGSERIAINKLINVNRRKFTNKQLPCAFLGSSRSAVSVPMAIINSIEGYPQFSHYATSSQLDDKSQYSLFGRVIPSDNGTADVAILFMRQKLKIAHFAIIHTDDSYGMAYVSSLQLSINKLAPEMKMYSIKISYHNPTKYDIQTAIKDLKSTQFHYFFGVINPMKCSEIMTEAYEQGIAGPGYYWIFSDTVWPDFFLDDSLYENSPPVIAATHGVALLGAVAGFPNMGMTVYDNFIKSWNGLNNEQDIKFLQDNIPIDVVIEDLLDGPSTDAALMYDATIALGLGACKAKKDKNYFGGEEHYSNVLDISFIGATGNVTFDKSTGSRDPLSASFIFTNIQLDTEGNATSIFKAVPSELFMNNEWINLSPYVFSDNSTVPPLELPAVTVNYNYLNPALRVLGFALSGILLLASISFASWTFKYRNGKIVKASLPFFLFAICFGAFLMGMSIIPLSFDDQIASPSACSIACMAVPWLFSTGFCVAFSALFTKVWKLNKLFFNSGMVRMSVKDKEVMLPMVIMTLLNVIVMVLWNIISPEKWVRTIVEVDAFGQTVSSLGSCDSKLQLPFKITICVINGGVLCLTLFQAYQARHIKTLLGETKYITSASASMFLAFAMGIPIKLLVQSIANVRYFINLCLIFVVGMSFFTSIFWPRYYLQRKLDRGEIDMKRVVSEFVAQSNSYRKKRSSERISFQSVVRSVMRRSSSLEESKMDESKVEMTLQDNTPSMRNSAVENFNEFTMTYTKQDMLRKDSTKTKDKASAINKIVAKRPFSNVVNNQTTSREKPEHISTNGNAAEHLDASYASTGFNEFLMTISKRNILQEDPTTSQDKAVDDNFLIDGMESANSIVNDLTTSQEKLEHISTNGNAMDANED